MGVEQIVARMGDLPMIPAIALKALEMSEDPQVSIHELQATLTQDQALTAQILRMANSSIYGLRREIATVSHAVAILGLDTTRFILSAACVQQVFRTGRSQPWAFGNRLLADHSWGAALCSREIARKVSYAVEEEAFLAGLMHDIGKAVLLKNAGDRYRLIANDVYHGEITFHEAELVVFGFSHAQAGSVLAARWNFPQQLAEAIGWHHDPEAAPKHKQLTCITALANRVMTHMGIGFEKAPEMILQEQPAARLLELGAADLDEIVVDTKAALERMSDVMAF
jgi:putative nucleotidyltransferase with HDIG domain